MFHLKIYANQDIKPIQNNTKAPTKQLSIIETIAPERQIQGLPISNINKLNLVEGNFKISTRITRCHVGGVLFLD